VKTLAKALNDIADSLPRVKLAAIMYPTSRMKKAVANLYAQLIRFLLRAESWYQRSRIGRAWESLAHPVELRYADILDNINMRTQEVHSLAQAASQAEQRDVHLEVMDLSRKQNASEAVLLEVRMKLIGM
jgi:hypothetical protein